MRDVLVDYEGLSKFNVPRFQTLAFLPEMGQYLPKEIHNLEITKDDVIEQPDSDEENVNEIPVEEAQAVIQRIQANSKAK